MSLDGRPDEHNHNPSEQHQEETDAEHAEHGNQNHSSSEQQDNLQKIKKKVERVVRTKGINYPVVLNPTGDIGARFNGHELPTNVLIDRSGNLRRRFVGRRPLPTMKRMIAEIDSQAAALVQ